MKNYPDFAFKRKKLWLRDVRKRWSGFRSDWNRNENCVTTGCAYYPPEVWKWLCEFEKMDKLMREYYKNA